MDGFYGPQRRSRSLRWLRLRTLTITAAAGARTRARRTPTSSRSAALTVRGIYCTYCADATTLAFVDGTFGADGIEFVVTHVNTDGSTAFTDQTERDFRPVG